MLAEIVHANPITFIKLGSARLKLRDNKERSAHDYLQNAYGKQFDWLNYGNLRMKSGNLRSGELIKNFLSV